MGDGGGGVLSKRAVSALGDPQNVGMLVDIVPLDVLFAVSDSGLVLAIHAQCRSLPALGRVCECG